MTCSQYKPNIWVFICDTDSIKDNKIHAPEHRFNCETNSSSADAAGMLLHIEKNSQRENWNYLLLKRFRSGYDVDLAVLVVSDSSSSGN
jgi:hypothetical protein